MVNMKLDKKEMPDACVGEQPDYPYGLCLHLENEVLEKLNMKDLPKVGGKLTMTATVEVKSISASDHDGAKMRKSVSLQITDMELKGAKAEKTMEQAIYGE